MVARKIVKVTSKLRTNYKQITSELSANNRKTKKKLQESNIKITDYLCKIMG